MSDFILKLFPSDEVAADKSGLIKQELIKSKFLDGGTVDYYGETYLKAGDAFCSFFEFEDKDSAESSYRDDIRIKISPDGYGVIMEEDAEEPEFIDRKNVVEIWNADGNFFKWDKLVLHLKQVTGDAYTGE